MKLKGLSKYDVRFTEDDRVRVYSLRCNKYMSPNHRDAMDKWQLKTDDGKFRHVTEGQLRFMRSHPEVSAEGISLRATGIKFRKDGTVDNLYGGERGRSYARFTSPQDALNTVLFLISAHEGDRVPLLRFVERSRWNAITTVASLLKCAYSTVAPYYESGAARFLRETEDFNVERVQPLFAWLCKCLKWVVKEQRSLKIKTSDHMERFGEVRLAQMD